MESDAPGDEKTGYPGRVEKRIVRYERDDGFPLHLPPDHQPGTLTFKSEVFFAAVRGLGGIARLVLLPFEEHGYRAAKLKVPGTFFCLFPGMCARQCLCGKIRLRSGWAPRAVVCPRVPLAVTSGRRLRSSMSFAPRPAPC